MRDREPDPNDPEPPTPEPQPLAPREGRPEQPVPVSLLDLEERMKAAKKGPNLGRGRFTNGEIDRRFREEEIRRTGYGVGM